MSDLTSDQIDAITHAWLDLEASKVLFNRMCGVPSFADRPPLQRTRMLEELAVACRDSVKELEDAFPFLMEGVEDELT